ncbi:hypothetical protein Tco_1039496 [Tanacetum coccineum]
MGNEKVCGGSDEDAHAVTVKVLHNPNSGSVPLNTVCSFTEVTGYTVKERFYVATTPIVNMPRVQYNVDVATTFGVSLTTIGDLDMLIKDIEAGKHDELLYGMTNDKRIAVMDTLIAMCELIEDENSPNDPIIQYAYIHEKPNSYVGAAGGSKPKLRNLKANFRLLFSENLCEGADFSIPREIVETPIMLDFYTSSMCIESWGRSSFARCLIEINVDDVLKESLTMGVPLTGGLGFTFETVTIDY